MSQLAHAFALSLRRQLQIITALSVLAGLCLAVPFFVFAGRTTSAAHSLVEKGVAGSDMASNVEHLLQQHRAVVMRASRGWDESQLEAAKGELEAASRSLTTALAGVSGLARAEDEASAEELKPMLPSLLNAGSDVVDLAVRHAGTVALQAAGTSYIDISGTTMDVASRWRDRQGRVMQEQVGLLFAASDAMVSWARGGTFAAVVIGCFGLAIGHGMLRRLWQIRDCMLRLAACEPIRTVPYVADRDEIGSMARAIEVFRNNALQAAVQDAELRLANTRFEAALNNMLQGICMFDGAGRLDMFNLQFCTIYGLNPADVRLGMGLPELLALVADMGCYPGLDRGAFLKERMGFIGKRERGSLIDQIKDGRQISIVHRPMPSGGHVATFEDVTDRRAADAQIAYMSRHDALTGLPNRLVLHERIDQQLTETTRGGRSAVLFLDLDHFKRVNEMLGHPVGDSLLRAVSDRLLACVREGDTVARLGGDEFAIVQAGIARPEDAKLLAERIIATLASPFLVHGHAIVIGTSIGLALIPEDGTDAPTLIKSADMALYRAKLEERGTFCFFESTMDARLQLRRQLELDLRAGLENEEFQLYYQPLVDPVREQVVGFEALLRWQHPTRGMVSPAEFIPIAEEIGLIVPLGEWVIRTACAEAAGWPEQIKVALNLSPMQFRSRNLVPTVVLALQESGLAAGRLELEVTETLLLQDNESTISMLHELRTLGARISMDDFGTGYSSLSYLRSFPFDKIKIDQSFIRDLSQREDAIHIVRAIRGLCAGLGIKTTAEGVETGGAVCQDTQRGMHGGAGVLVQPPSTGCRGPVDH